MALIDRLAGIDEDNKLPVHQFYAALFEFARGELTKPQIVAYFGLDAGEEAELDWLITQYQAAADKPAYLERVQACFILAETQSPGYSSTGDLQGKLTA